MHRLIFALVTVFLFSFSAHALALPPGFVALSELPMNWKDAKAFCQQKGRKLPRINNSDSWNGKGVGTIDGFGTHRAPWPSGLPVDRYWTGTDITDAPSHAHYVHHFSGDGSVITLVNPKSNEYRVVCVP